MRKNLPWILWTISVLFVVADVIVMATSRWDELVVVPLSLVNATIGLLILQRHPGHRVGWAFLAAGVLYGFYGFSLVYTVRTLVIGPVLPGALAAAWLGEWGWVTAVTVVVFVIPMLFPAGSLLSRRWVPVFAAGLFGGALAALGLIFTPGSLETLPELTSKKIPNPTGLTGTGGVVADLMAIIGTTTLIVAALAAAVSVILRFRRSAGSERLQMKWLAFSALLSGLLLAAMSDLWETELGNAFGPLIFLVVPTGAGIAILKHRLYDIDIIINKTLVYGALTAALGGGYFGLVVVLQQLTRPFTEGSDLAIAASTLVVAALFRPARGRVQAFVDRRFYRRKYDAARTLEDFSARLTREIDLDTLNSELRALLDNAMGPSRTWMWLGPKERLL